MSAMNSQGVGSEGKPIYLDPHGAAKETTPATSSDSPDTVGNFNDNKLVTKGYVDKNKPTIPTAGFLLMDSSGQRKVRSNINANAVNAASGAIKPVGVRKDANGNIQLELFTETPQTPTSGPLISTDGRKVSVKVDDSLVNADGTVKDTNFLGVSNDRLVARGVPSSICPSLHWNDSFIRVFNPKTSDGGGLLFQGTSRLSQEYPLLDDTQKANLSQCKYAVFFSDYTKDAPFEVNFTAHVLIPLGSIGIFADTSGALMTNGDYRSRTIIAWNGSTASDFTNGDVEYCKFETESGKLMWYSTKSRFFTRSGNALSFYSGFLNNYATFGGYPVLNPTDDLKLIVCGTGKTQTGTGSSYDLHVALRIVPVY